MSLVEQALSYVRAISPYQPGKPITELAREMGIPVEKIRQARLQREPAGHEPEGEKGGRGGDQRHRALSGPVRADQGAGRALRLGAEPGRARQWLQRRARPDRPRFPGAGPLGGFRAARLRRLSAGDAVDRRRTDRRRRPSITATTSTPCAPPSGRIRASSGSPTRTTRPATSCPIRKCAPSSKPCRRMSWWCSTRPTTNTCRRPSASIR